MEKTLAFMILEVPRAETETEAAADMMQSGIIITRNLGQGRKSWSHIQGQVRCSNALVHVAPS